MSRRSTLWIEQMAETMRKHGAVRASRKLTRANGSVEEVSLQLAAPMFSAPLSANEGHAVSPEVVRVMADEEEAEEVAATPEEVALAAKRRRYENLFPGISDSDLKELPEYP